MGTMASRLEDEEMIEIEADIERRDADHRYRAAAGKRTPPRSVASSFRF
jgi:hypothetical protein